MSVAFRAVALAAILGLAAPQLVVAAGRSGPPPVPQLDILLRPVRGGGPEVLAIDVRMQIALPAEAGAPLALTAPIVYAGVPGVAERMQEIRVTDGQGEVAFDVTDDPPAKGGFPYYRHWKAGRATEGTVTLGYRAVVQPAGSRNGPPFGIRASGGGVSGAGSGFLLVPATKVPLQIRVRWDLEDLAPGSIGVTSFGDGEFTLHEPAEQLLQGWYLAGPAGRFPAQGHDRGFSAAWLGTPPFDAGAEMAWSAGVYQYLGRYFGYLDPAPRYRVFMRFLETPPFGGGTALPNSFMLSRGPLRAGEPPIAPRATLFHEMIHQWVGQVEAPVGVSSWFSEGLTTYYTNLLPLRGAFDTVEAYGNAVNRLVRQYYTNPARDWSAEEIAGIGFGDDRVRHMPYERGALYFADLDARIRAASRGRRNLESLLFPMFRDRQRGRRFDHADWIARVTRELGAAEGARFSRVVLEGSEMLEPASSAFGPCFERRPAKFEETPEKSFDGFEWVRVAGIPDERCRRGK